MRKKHDYGQNSKVVAGPHTFHQPMPEQGGGPAGAAGGGMDASGGAAANFDDGGQIKGDSWSGKLEDYGNALKQTASDVGDAIYKRIPKFWGQHGAPGNHIDPETGKYETPATIADKES